MSVVVGQRVASGENGEREVQERVAKSSTPASNETTCQCSINATGPKVLP